MTKDQPLAGRSRRRLIPLLGVAFIVLASLVIPAQTAWADNDKSDSDGGGNSDSSGDSSGGGDDSGGNDSGGGNDSSGGDDSDNDGDSIKDDNDGSDGSDDRPSGGSSRGGGSSTRKALEDGDGSLATKLTGKIASLQEIEALAAKMVPGEIVDVRLRRENGRVVYRLKIIQKNDRLVVLRIDAKTRKRLGSMNP
jgi:uncharacterized membrane protein YkoI